MLVFISGEKFFSNIRRKFYVSYNFTHIEGHLCIKQKYKEMKLFIAIVIIAASVIFAAKD